MRGKECFILKRMVLLCDPELGKTLSTSDEDVVLVLFEWLYNVIRGHVKVQNDDLGQYKNVFKTVLPKKGFG